VTEVCTVNYIDHVGVAVKDIEAALAFFKKVFDVPDAKIELMEDQGVRATLIEVGQTRLELLEPTGPESGVGRFIERRGEGLHHLAFNVTDISTSSTRRPEKGCRERSPSSIQGRFSGS